MAGVILAEPGHRAPAWTRWYAGSAEDDRGLPETSGRRVAHRDSAAHWRWPDEAAAPVPSRRGSARGDALRFLDQTAQCSGGDRLPLEALEKQINIPVVVMPVRHKVARVALHL